MFWYFKTTKKLYLKLIKIDNGKNAPQYGKFATLIYFTETYFCPV